TLTCKPNPGVCPAPPTTTTTVVSTTTTTGGQVCGNGIREGMEDCDDGNGVDTDACTNNCTFATCGDGAIQAGVEQCDPPGSDCAGGQVCNGSCQCVAAVPCACGAPTPAQLKYMTSAAGVGSAPGSVAPAKCVQCPVPANCFGACTTDAQCLAVGGHCAGPLT